MPTGSPTIWTGDALLFRDLADVIPFLVCVCTEAQKFGISEVPSVPAPPISVK